MAELSVWLAFLVGAIQGIVEWLPISSEGGVSIVLTLAGSSPAAAVRLALFLHAGTGLAALAYYRTEVDEIIGDVLVRSERPGRLDPVTRFVIVATVVSIFVAGVAYLTLLEVVTALSGGAFIAAIGGLLVLTGVVQWLADDAVIEAIESPKLLDALLVGVGQGLAVLPGVSRSGITVSALLLRGHPGEASFRLSFLLSIPAAFGAGLLAIVDEGGLPGGDLQAGLVSLVVAAVVGFASITALMRIVRRLPFWLVCIGLGGLAIGGGVLLVI